MEGVPATIGSSGDDGLSAPPQHQPAPLQAQAQAQVHVNGGGGGGGGGGDDGGGGGGSISGGFTEDGDRNSGGNRWPKQETLALIKIRSEMDAAFRDSNLKGPLWDDISRKLSELGFHRSAKKCREKFENVYKYHRRTKDGRTSKSDKTYRFFDQLQALEASPRGAFPPPPPAATKPPPIFTGMPNNAATPPHPLPVTVPSFNLAGSDQNNVSPISVAAPAMMVVPPPIPAMNHKRNFPFSQPNMSGSTNSDESYTSSDEEPPKKKRKWQEFFGKLMNEVIEKQEELQMKFLDTLERRERDRVAREEAWRAQEIAKMNQEHERLVKERSIAAAKDAAVVTFLQKMTGKTLDTAAVAAFPTIQVLQQQQQQIQKSPLPLPPPPHHQVLPSVAVAVPVSVPPPPPAIPVSPPTISVAPPTIQVAPPTIQVAPPTVPSVALSPMVKNVDGGGGENMLSPSPSRWPKAEINALISLRTQLDIKYQENVPKGPLWEDISAAMRKLGYNRNAKRCKEKWENINKYYKKMKEGNKKRPEDSKTCPYFHQLDAIYSEKANNSETKMTAIVARPEQQWPPAVAVAVQEKTPPQQQQRGTDAVYIDKAAINLGFTVKPETQITPVVAAWPQQQWLLPTVVQETPRQPTQRQLSAVGTDDQGSGNDDDYDDDDEDEDEEDDDDVDDGGDEIVPNKISSMAAV